MPIRRVLLGLAVAAVAGCAKAPELPVYPPPPDEPRFAYEFTLRRPGDINVGGALRKMAAGTDQPVFAKPHDVAALNGRIFVSDTIGRRIHVFDVPNRSYFTFGHRLEGKLTLPVAIALDSAGNVYVADAEAGRVVVYDGLGMFVRAIGAGDLDRPTGLAVTPDGRTIYVVDGDIDSVRHRVVAYDSEGKRRFEFGTRGGEPGQFNLPTAAAMGRDGTIHVLDAGNFRVQTFAADGTFLRTWGDLGNIPGRFSRPRDLASDAEGNVYVSDSAFGNIQIFDPEGQMLMHLGHFAQSDDPGTFVMLAGLAIDETGRIYAVDQVLQKVQIFRRWTKR